MLGDHRGAGKGGAAHSLEARSPWFPVHYVGQCACGHYEASEVSRHVKRLDRVLRIVFVGGVAPTAQLHIEFAKVLLPSPVVEGIEAQNRGGLQMGGIANRPGVGSVAQTLRQHNLSTRPTLAVFLYLQM